MRGARLPPEVLVIRINLGKKARTGRLCTRRARRSVPSRASLVPSEPDFGGLVCLAEEVIVGGVGNKRLLTDVGRDQAAVSGGRAALRV